MSFQVFSEFETTSKSKFKHDKCLTNITISKFLEKSCRQISLSKHSNIFAIFHTKSSRLNYIASELVLQYLEKRGMAITIQCAKEETRSKYFRKHSDKWIQRELHLRTRLDLFNILISDRKKKVISTNVLKSPKNMRNTQYIQSYNYEKQNHSINKDSPNKENNSLSSSFVTPSPTPSPSPKDSHIIELSATGDDSNHNSSKSPNSQQWPIYLSTSSSQNSNSQKSTSSPKRKSTSKNHSPKNSNIINVTEISTENQFYFQEKIVNELDIIESIGDRSIQTPNGNILSTSDSDEDNSMFNNQNKNLNKHCSNLNKQKTDNFELEISSENEFGKEKYSVSEANIYRTTSVVDKMQTPRFLQLKNKGQELDISDKNVNTNKEKQVSFANQPSPTQAMSKNVVFSNSTTNNLFKNSKNNITSPSLPSSLISGLPNTKTITKKNVSKDYIDKLNLEPNSTKITQDSNNSESDQNHVLDFPNDSSNKDYSSSDNKRHRRSRESRKRVRLSQNMPPKAKPVDDADEYDIEFLKDIMSEDSRSERKKKYELYKQKAEAEKYYENEENQKTYSIQPNKNENKIREFDFDNENDENDNGNFYFQEPESERDWEKIVNSESCSELDNPKITDRFIKRNEYNNNSNSDSIIDSECESDQNYRRRFAVTDRCVKHRNYNQVKSFNLSFDDNCFCFERQPTDSSNKENSVDVGVEVNFDSENQSQNSLKSLEFEEEEEINQTIKPSYYSFSIAVLEAKNVVKTDLIKTCDPYCKIIINDKSDVNDDENNDNNCSFYNDALIDIQTKVAEDTQNPEWNEQFTFNIEDIKEKSISFLIYDHDAIGSDKLLNSLTLPLIKFVNEDGSESSDEWMTMKSQMQIGTLTDIHLNIKITLEYGPTDNVSFNIVNQNGRESKDLYKIIEEEEEDNHEINEIKINRDEETENSEVDEIKLKSDEVKENSDINKFEIKSDEESEAEDSLLNQINVKSDEESEAEDSLLNQINVKSDEESENTFEIEEKSNSMNNEQNEIENDNENMLQIEEESEIEIENDDYNNANENNNDFDVEKENIILNHSENDDNVIDIDVNIDN